MRRAAWLQDHGLPVKSETLGVSSRVLKAASSLQTQPEEPVVASCGPTKTATLTMRCVQRAAQYRAVTLDAHAEQTRRDVDRHVLLAHL